MFSFIKSLLGGVGTYLALAGVALAAYFKIKAMGRQEAEEVAERALDEAEQESASDVAELNRKVAQIKKEDHSSLKEKDLN